MVGLLEARGCCSPIDKDSHPEEAVMAKVIEFYVPTNFRT